MVAWPHQKYIHKELSHIVRDAKHPNLVAVNIIHELEAALPVQPLPPTVRRNLAAVQICRCKHTGVHHLQTRKIIVSTVFIFFATHRQCYILNLLKEEFY